MFVFGNAVGNECFFSVSTAVGEVEEEEGEDIVSVVAVDIVVDKIASSACLFPFFSSSTITVFGTSSPPLLPYFC